MNEEEFVSLMLKRAAKVIPERYLVPRIQMWQFLNLIYKSMSELS